ncbi:hypothetical protein EDB92DRAFT_1483833 [Lactarius akahatsu]|uniref:Uncharacterized protein n=1 Tax=Lactarius akahatsu TaxID=416441 RepID=A0AAD4LAE9_9AGAM|nr:hypothetical protein EDB92DRAFT_1483833 [Lactarius akahatsu]
MTHAFGNVILAFAIVSTYNGIRNFIHPVSVPVSPSVSPSVRFVVPQVLFPHHPLVSTGEGALDVNPSHSSPRPLIQGRVTSSNHAHDRDEGKHATRTSTYGSVWCAARVSKHQNGPGSSPTRLQLTSPRTQLSPAPTAIERISIHASISYNIAFTQSRGHL